MSKKLMRLCSWIVTITLMINMLPVNALATDSQSSAEMAPAETTVPLVEVEETVPVAAKNEADDNAEILEEVLENRTEYTKDFKLSNGLHMAAVYPEPVHYEVDGEWEDIDNTLKLAETRSGNVYTNTAGKWLVSFPQDLTGDKSVTVINGDYTVSFAMVGQLRNTGHVVMKADEEMSLEEIEPAPEEQETIEVVDQVTIPTEVVPSQDAEVTDDEIAVEITEAPVVDTIPSAPPEDPISEGPTSVSEPEDLVEEATEVSLESTTPTESSEAPTEVIEATTVPEDTTVLEDTIPLVETTTPVETTIPETPEVPIEESTLEIAPESTMKIESAALQKFKAADILATGTNISVAKESRANIEKVERKGKLEGKLEQVVPEKLTSRLRYDEVYTNTDVVYDLHGHKVKESIIMTQYEADLRGFSYILEVGNMVVELTEDNVIELYDHSGEELVMVMPAPYLFDSAGEFCYDVDINLKKVDDYYAMSYILPRAWLADEDRVWPVTLDPALEQIGNDSAAVDYTVGENITIPKDSYISQVNAGYSPSTGEMKTYIQYTTLPMALTSSDVIVGAYITLMCVGGNASASRIEAREVTSSWTKAGLTWSNQPTVSSLVEDYANVTYNSSSYKSFTWEITDLVRKWYTGVNNGLVFQLSATDVSTARSAGAMNYKAFYSTEFIYDEGNSILTVVYRNNNGLESYWDYTATSAGSAGTGYVNQYTGNLVWIRNLVGISGNRMPVDINLIYNANDTASNTYGVGYGWRTNYNQKVSQWSVNSAYYVWQDGDGTKHYFQYSSDDAAYVDEDGLDLKLTATGSSTTKYCITDKYGNKSYFDTAGRLTKMSDNQATPSSINITYVTDTSPKILSITDGVGRRYSFSYSGANLAKITAPSQTVTFGYSGSQLTSVTNTGGTTSIASTYGYGSGNRLTSVTDSDGYNLTITYSTVTSADDTELNKMPRRVAKIEEKDGSTYGGVLNFTYAQNQTTITDYSGNKQVIQFNTWGNTISVHDGQGRAQKANYTSNKAEEAGDLRGNQLIAASKMQNTVKNILSDTSFENSTTWNVTNTTLVSQAISSSEAYHGSKSLALSRTTASSWSGGVYLPAISVEGGASYTFSAYVKGKAYLELNDGSTTYSGEKPEKSTEWTRLELNYTNPSSSSRSVYLRLMTVDAGTSYMDCVQFEKMPTASRYNLIQNGDFTTTSNWSSSSGRTTQSPAAAPQLDTNVYKMTGNTGGTNRITQTVKVSGAAGDSFMLAGWGKADSVPLTTSSREFGIVAVFSNTDGTTTTHTAHFNPYVGNSAWQYTAAMITTDKAYSSVTIRLAYDYNANTAYFDGIQFYKEEFGESYTYDDEGNLTKVNDSHGGETKYDYYTNGVDVKKITLPSGDSINYTYDGYHNVETTTTADGVETTYTYNTYGNLLTTTVGSNITTRNTYTTDGNYLATTVDASGKTTTYSYDTTYGTLKYVRYPNDGEATQTNYTYDGLQRLKSVSANVSSVLDEEKTLSAQYTYFEDYLDKITTGSTVYDFDYGNFGLRSQVKAGSNVLANYTYTSRTNYLATLAYGNGDSVQYTYNQQGDVTKQTYTDDNATVTFKYNNSGYLASTVDSSSGITTMYYYDLSDRLASYTEKGTNYSHTAKYKYDENNNLVNLYDSIMGTPHTTVYAYDSDNRVESVTDGTISETYDYNTTYGYLDEKIALSGTSVILTDYFTYESGTSRVDTLNNKSKGNYDITHNYEYDDNGNIESDTFGGKTTSYVYDTANQLIRENNQAANKTTVWTYDDAGNITSRKEYAYTTGTLSGTPTTVSYVYGNSGWGDLLTCYNGQTVTSDTIGNITNVGTSRTYTWKHGRQLASSYYNSATWNYTYNADGMRVKRTSGNKAYTYIYNGDMLRYMEYDSNTTDNVAAAKLYFTFDASGLPISVNYTPEGSTTSYLFYYVHNLQGDVEALVHGSTGNVSIWYSYDAWGNIVDSDYMTTNHTGADTLININPFRYRSYIYDPETELYYLQSRYYDPEMGRFINADAFNSTGQGILGNNMFTYCLNNPVNYIDSEGTISVKAALTSGLIDAVISSASTYLTTGSIDSAIVAFGTGFVGGFLGELNKQLEFVYNLGTSVVVMFECIDNGADLGASVLAAAASFLSCYAFSGLDLDEYVQLLFNFTFDFGISTATNGFIEVISGYYSNNPTTVATITPLYETAPQSKPNNGAGGGMGGLATFMCRT